LDGVVEIVDLSHPVTTDMPVFPGDPEVTIQDAATFDADGFRVMELHIGSHTGTHIDAPSHFIAAGDTIDHLALGHFIAPATIVSLKHIGAEGTIGKDVFHGLDVAGRIVVLHTGWDQYWGTDHYARHPFVSEEAAELLAAAQVAAVAIDAFSIDPTHDTIHHFPAHMALLGAGIPIAENLRGIDQITWDNPVVSLLPLRLQAGDGAPVRAVAWRGDR
jgi:arylformamidase